MRRIVVALGVGLFLAVRAFGQSSTLPSTQPATGPSALAPLHRPVPAIQRVLIISVDGLRPDMLLRCQTPHMHDLFEHGSYSFWARTTPLAITLPSHTSMLTGVIPRRHEVEWNKDLPLSRPVYPMFPTIFEVTKNHGYTTAMAAGKSKFSVLVRPGTLDWCFIPDAKETTDTEVAAEAVRIIHDHQPQVMFVHLPGCDNVGHLKGWGSAAQRVAVQEADAAVGRVLAAIDQAGVRSSTFVLVTADHGGAGRTHLPDDARARHIPWIASGPGIRQDFDLTTDLKLVINTEDTFATVAYLLGLQDESLLELDGKPIKEIVERSELLQAVR